jgi:hypothetical protein
VNQSGCCSGAKSKALSSSSWVIYSKYLAVYKGSPIGRKFYLQFISASRKGVVFCYNLQEKVSVMSTDDCGSRTKRLEGSQVTSEVNLRVPNSLVTHSNDHVDTKPPCHPTPLLIHVTNVPFLQLIQLSYILPSSYERNLQSNSGFEFLFPLHLGSLKYWY